jgi:hypothetical protein
VVRAPKAFLRNAFIGVSNMRQDFGDTKHHSVFISLLATSRFLEYFTATSDVAVHGTAAAALSSGATVQVSHVVPPVTRSSLEKDAHPAAGFPPDLVPFISGYGSDPVFTVGAQGHVAARRAERDRTVGGRRA